jgi:hypothetical protein
VDPTVKSKEALLGFKVWLELADLPPHTWSEQEIATTTSSFKLVLAHTPLASISSYERL